MRQLFAALFCGLCLTTQAGAEVALPRLSPLVVLDAEGVPTGGTVTVPFGQPLVVLDRTGAGGAVVTVQDAIGAAFAVNAADLISPAAGQAGLVAMADPARDSGERPDLPLWDSAARGRLYLQGGAADSLRPALTEQPGGVFPATGLPVFAVEAAPTTIGRPVLLAGAWVPVMPEGLDPSGTATPAKVVLHVLVDGSDYARDFTLDTLQQLSRTLSEGDQIAEYSRQVIYDNGALRDEGTVPAAGLRAEWPEAGAGAGTLTDALADALDALADDILPGDDAAHVVLVLVGPGLGTDPDALARVTAAATRLTGLRGVVLAQGTPEPNPANDVILGQMAGGATARFMDFGGDAMGAIDAVLSTAPAGDATAIAARREAICALAAERLLPCVIAVPGVLPPVASADWVALPLWFVMDGTALDLVPSGMDAMAARAAQDDIRTCHMAGQVWDAAKAVCAATAGPIAADDDGLRANLLAVQGDLSARTQERDTALEDLSRLTAEWDDQRSALRAEADEALANLAAAQMDLDTRAETIATQEAQLSEQADAITDLTDRSDALELSVSDLSAELETVKAEAARLAEDLDTRDAELLASADQVADLIAARDEALANLAQTEDQLAATQAEGERLTADLTALKTAQAEAEAALTQERADWQAKADAAAQILAEMTTARDQSAAQVADLTAAQTALQGQVADLTAQLADVTAARDQLVAQVADLTAQLADQTTAHSTEVAALTAAQTAALQATAEAETAAKKATAQLLAAQADYAALVAERDDLAAKLSVQTARADDLAAVKADLSLAESEIRADYAAVTRQLSEAQAKVAELEAARAAAVAEAAIPQTALIEAQTKLVDLEAARTSAAAEAATVQTMLTEVQAKLAQTEAALLEAQAQGAAATERMAALQTDRDALAEQVTKAQGDARATVQDLTDRLAKSEAEVIRLTDALTTALAARPIAEDMTAPAGDALEAGLALAVNPSLKPKPRPSADMAVAAAAPAKTPAKTASKAPAKTAVKVAAAAPAPKPAASRRVAPATTAPQLKGCQFQWVGTEGRLVCP
jgi:chromosome segregation ATPase